MARTFGPTCLSISAQEPIFLSADTENVDFLAVGDARRPVSRWPFRDSEINFPPHSLNCVFSVVFSLQEPPVQHTPLPSQFFLHISQVTSDQCPEKCKLILILAANQEQKG